MSQCLQHGVLRFTLFWPPRESFMTGFDIFAIAIVLLVIFTLFAGIKTVPQGYDWTIERFGKFTRTLAPGLNIIIPYFDRVGRKMNMMEQVISIPEEEVITKDNATVTVDGVEHLKERDAVHRHGGVVLGDHFLLG